jgi:hypothetical protein
VRIKKMRAGKVFEFYPPVLGLSVVRQRHSIKEKANISKSPLLFNWFFSHGSQKDT